MSILIKTYLNGSFDEQNVTLVIMSYEIYETRRRRIELIILVKSSVCRQSDHISECLMRNRVANT